MTQSAIEVLRGVTDAIIGLGFFQSGENFDSEILPSTVIDRSFVVAPGPFEFSAAGGSYGVLVQLSVFVAFDRKQLDYPAQVVEVLIAMEQIVDALVGLEFWEPVDGAPAASASLSVSDRAERVVLSINSRFGYGRKRG